MPEEIVFYVANGVDMFDCVLPTRNARHGMLFVWNGDPKEVVRDAFARAVEGASDDRIAGALYHKIQITKETYTLDKSLIDVHGVPTSTQFTRAYLRHLFKTDEILGYRLATMQNLGFYFRLMTEIRGLLERS